MKEQEIYQKIGELLWSIMPDEAVRIDFIGSIYPEHYSGGAEWVVANGDIHYFPLGQRPDEIEWEIINLMTQYKFSLFDNMEFNIKFAYVPDEDSWPMLYLRGVSDLEENEIKEYGIPREIWEERVKAKKEQQNS